MPRAVAPSVAILAVLALAPSSAEAQAPGAAPPEVVPPQPTSHVMDRRWSVSAGLGWETLQVKTESGKGDKITFAMLDLAGRFRVMRTVDVGLGIVGGGAEGGDVSTSGLYLDGRYRFLAERKWNLSLGLGLGAASVAAKDGTKEEKQGRGSLRVMFGVERRFKAFALYGDIRVIGVAGQKDLAEPANPPLSWQFSKYGLSGGHVSFGGTFYF